MTQLPSGYFLVDVFDLVTICGVVLLIGLVLGYVIWDGIQLWVATRRDVDDLTDLSLADELFEPTWESRAARKANHRRRWL